MFAELWVMAEFFWKNFTNYLRSIALGSSGEVVTSPPLNRKVGCSRPTMIRARCLRVRQHYPVQKNNQKKLHVVLKQGHNSGSPWWAVQLVCWSYPSWINDLNLKVSGKKKQCYRKVFPSIFLLKNRTQPKNWLILTELFLGFEKQVWH